MRISDWSSDVCSSDLGAYKLPLVLCVINNGWAISVPRSAQTGAETLAQKGLAGGLHCLQVDGNDLVAALEGMRRAAERRSEERRVGKGCVSTCRSRWSPVHLKKKKQIIQKIET